MADVFADAPLRLERDARQELVAELASQGMSTRAIAPIVGVSQMQVVRDAQAAPETKVSPERDDGLNRGARNLAPEVEPQTMVRVDPLTGEVEDVPARHVTGIDGKEYTVPAQRKPNRRALTDLVRHPNLVYP